MTKREGESSGFNLEERRARFGEAVVVFCKRAKGDDVDAVLLRQLVRSGTSVGANYCEANDAESKRDFRHKIGLCRKESKESQHWLRMLAAARPDLREDIKALWREAKELNLIFGKIRRSCG